MAPSLLSTCPDPSSCSCSSTNSSNDLALATRIWQYHTRWARKYSNVQRRGSSVFCWLLYACPFEAESTRIVPRGCFRNHLSRMLGLRRTFPFVCYHLLLRATISRSKSNTSGVQRSKRYEVQSYEGCVPRQMYEEVTPRVWGRLMPLLREYYSSSTPCT